MHSPLSTFAWDGVPACTAGGGVEGSFKQRSNAPDSNSYTNGPANYVSRTIAHAKPDGVALTMLVGIQMHKHTRTAAVLRCTAGEGHVS
jgi:hypothetical protein